MSTKGVRDLLEEARDRGAGRHGQPVVLNRPDDGWPWAHRDDDDDASEVANHHGVPPTDDTGDVLGGDG